MPPDGRLLEARFILLHGIPFLTLSPEIRRLKLFCPFIQNLSVSRLYLPISCSMNVTMGLNMVF